MKGVNFLGLGNGARSVNGGRVDFRWWKLITVGFTAFLMTSLIGAAGIVVALPAVPSPVLREVGPSRVVVTIGTMTVEMVERSDGVRVAYTQAGFTHHVALVDDSGGYRYSIDGGSWRRVPLEPEGIAVTRRADYSSSDRFQDPDFHFNVRYWWDGVRFIRGYPAAYPHPDRGYYHVISKQDWRYWGLQLLHFQFGTDAVGLLANFGPFGVGALIGGVLGSLVGGVVGAALGAIAGAIIGGALAYAFNAVFVDEAGAIWWWINRSLVTAMDNIPWWLWFCGRCVEGYIAARIDYLRVGSFTANNDLRI